MRIFKRLPSSLRLAAAAVGVVLGLGIAAPLVIAQDLVPTLEAEFLERFTRFIEWPAGSSVGDSSTPFVIGVVDRGPVADALAKIAAKSKVKGKTLEVRTIQSPGQASSCNIVFIGPGNERKFDSIVAGVSGKPVLVVSDSSGYAKRGSMINFITGGEFINFEVNPSAAEAAGLRFAPELLALGEVVN